MSADRTARMAALAAGGAFEVSEQGFRTRAGVRFDILTRSEALVEVLGSGTTLEVERAVGEDGGPGWILYTGNLTRWQSGPASGQEIDAGEAAALTEAMARAVRDMGAEPYIDAD